MTLDWPQNYGKAVPPSLRFMSDEKGPSKLRRANFGHRSNAIHFSRDAARALCRVENAYTSLRNRSLGNIFRDCANEGHLGLLFKLFRNRKIRSNISSGRSAIPPLMNAKRSFKQLSPETTFGRLSVLPKADHREAQERAAHPKHQSRLMTNPKLRLTTLLALMNLG